MRWREGEKEGKYREFPSPTYVTFFEECLEANHPV